MTYRREKYCEYGVNIHRKAKQKYSSELFINLFFPYVHNSGAFIVASCIMESIYCSFTTNALFIKLGKV